MKPYLALTKINLRLAARERAVLFFNYIFPLIFFFAFGQMFHAERGSGINQVVTITLVIGILGSGLFGAGIRSVQERENNILRRYKVAPITPAPILLASMTVGLILYLPSVFLIFSLARYVYGMALPERALSLVVLVALGLLAFRSVGLMVAAVANSAQESQILVQLLYMPMLLLSGATFPLTFMPRWAQSIAEFLPASYLLTGMQGMMFREESLAANGRAVAGLIITAMLGTFISYKLFRWEKEQKIAGAAKLWIAAVLTPFLLLGGVEMRNREHITKAKLMDREMRRKNSVLIRDVRIFAGDGQVIENGAVLIRNGHIEAIFPGASPDAAALKADAIEAAGKTLLPGLIDTRVHLTQPESRDQPEQAVQRRLAAELYCGVTLVRSVADRPDVVQTVQLRNMAGEKLGADFFIDAGNGGGPQLSLVAAEAAAAAASGLTDLANGSLVQQIVPPQVLRPLLKRVEAREFASTKAPAPEQAAEALRKSLAEGAEMVIATGAGRPLVFHGAAVHRELKLWVDAGIPARVALQAATANGARYLHAAGHTGVVRKGFDADLLLVDGNPLQDITATERISSVFFKGERLNRGELLNERR